MRPDKQKKYIYLYAIILGIYSNASARWTEWISSLPAKSAIILASFRMR